MTDDDKWLEGIRTDIHQDAVLEIRDTLRRMDQHFDRIARSLDAIVYIMGDRT